jgi:CHAT domain-containing protein/tetratricopeptide (TPR) repeat protein
VAAAQDRAARIDQMLKESDELTNKGRYDEAAKIAEEALRLSRELSDKGRMARAFNFSGRAYHQLGRMEEALEAFKQAAARAAEINKGQWEAVALNNVGSALHHFGHYEEELGFLTRSLSLAQKLDDRRGETRTLLNIGILYRVLGDDEKSGPLLEEALRFSRELKDKRLELAALKTIAVKETHCGHHTSAFSYYEQALALEPEVKDAGLRVELLNDMANAYSSLGDYQKAIDLLKQALDLAHGEGNRRMEAINLENLANQLYKLGRLSEALESATRALEMLRRIGDFPEVEWQIDQLLAQVKRASGRPEEALSDYRQTIAKVERLRSGAVPTEDSRASVIAARRNPFVETADLLFALKQEAEALEVAEACHARAFLDQLAESKIDARQDLTNEQRRHEDDLFKRLSAIQKQLWQEGMPASLEQRLKAELIKAEDDLEAFRLELRRVNPRYASAQYPKPLGVERIQHELLDADTTLIEYLLGEERSFVWAVSPQKVAVAVLPPRKQIEDQVAAYRQILAKKASALTLRHALAEYQSQSWKLSELLLRPIAGALASSRRLVIVPDGLLAYLPFETLSVAASPQPGSLLERFAVTYVPSASAWAAIKTQGKAPAPKLLLAFGDPVYTRGAGGRAPKTNGATARSMLPDAIPFVPSFGAERGFNFTSLPYTRAEVTSIGAIYPPKQSQIYLGAEAREETVKTEKLDQYRHLHFAAHGIINEERPARSGIVLSLEANSPEDGVLRISEIMRLKLNADLVTLSACNTGLGKLIDGEGVIGLTRAFFYAGATSVAVSLWNVNDCATAELMKAFYQRIHRGLAKDEALRQAKLTLIKGRQRSWQYPYFWAPFVLVGGRD